VERDLVPRDQEAMVPTWRRRLPDARTADGCHTAAIGTHDVMVVAHASGAASKERAATALSNALEPAARLQGSHGTVERRLAGPQAPSP